MELMVNFVLPQVNFLVLMSNLIRFNKNEKIKVCGVMFFKTIVLFKKAPGLNSFSVITRVTC